MCITKNQLQTKVNELRQYKRILEETNTLIDQLENEIKEYMENEKTDILTGNDYKITWKTYIKNIFDSKALKEDIPELFTKYQKETSYKRFILK